MVTVTDQGTVFDALFMNEASISIKDTAKVSHLQFREWPVAVTFSLQVETYEGIEGILTKRILTATMELKGILTETFLVETEVEAEYTYSKYQHWNHHYSYSPHSGETTDGMSTVTFVLTFAEGMLTFMFGPDGNAASIEPPETVSTHMHA